MKNNPEIEEELKKIRRQGKAQVIIMVSSLVLVFLWFSCLAWLFEQETFSQEAFEYFGQGALGSSGLIILIFGITVIFTFIYVYILKKLAPSMSID